MSYCTLDDLLLRFGTDELVRLTNIDDPSATTINAAVLAVMITDADAVINDFLCNYLPLPSIPARLVRAACDIVRYFLYKDMPTEHVVARFDDACHYLKHIDLDQMGIGADATGTAVIDVSDSIGIDQGRSLFGQHQMHDYLHDNDETFGLGRL